MLQMHCEITIPTDAICALSEIFEIKQSALYKETVVLQIQREIV